MPVSSLPFFLRAQDGKDRSGRPLSVGGGGANAGGQCASEEKELREKVNSEVGLPATGDSSTSYQVPGDIRYDIILYGARFTKLDKEETFFCSFSVSPLFSMCAGLLYADGISLLAEARLLSAEETWLPPPPAPELHRSLLKESLRLAPS